MTSSFDTPNERNVFIVELTTRDGRVCERYETYAEARQRVDQFPADSLVGLAFIFEELADGSERLLREDGKPLQFHRLLVEDVRESPDAPLPLAEEGGPDGLPGKIRFVEQQPDEGWDDLPLL
jgi:hypothetical protein